MRSMVAGLSERVRQCQDRRVSTLMPWAVACDQRVTRERQGWQPGTSVPGCVETQGSVFARHLNLTFPAKSQWMLQDRI